MRGQTDPDSITDRQGAEHDLKKAENGLGTQGLAP